MRTRRELVEDSIDAGLHALGTVMTGDGTGWIAGYDINELHDVARSILDIVEETGDALECADTFIKSGCSAGHTRNEVCYALSAFFLTISMCVDTISRMQGGFAPETLQ